MKKLLLLLTLVWSWAIMAIPADFIPQNHRGMTLKELKKVQFYLSDALLLTRPEQNTRTGVDAGHGLSTVHSTHWETIYLKAHTPCLITGMSADTLSYNVQFKVAFEKNGAFNFHSPGGSLCWPLSWEAAATDSATVQVLAETARRYGLAFKGTPRKTEYGGKEYYLLGFAWLQASITTSNKNTSTERAVPGLYLNKP